MVACLLLVVLGAEPSPQAAAPPSPQQLKQLSQAVEKRLQVLTTVSERVRLAPQATNDDLIALRSALSDALQSAVEYDNFIIRNAQVVRPYVKDPDEVHRMRTTLDELLRALAGPKDAPAVAARWAAQLVAKQQKEAEVEAQVNLKALFVAEKSFFQEMDRYSPDFQAIGFAPEGCRDGTRPAVPDGTWIAGCRFIYRVQVKGTCPDCRFEGLARGAADPVRGVGYAITSEQGQPTRLESEGR
jgi:hypothetical protein